MSVTFGVGGALLSVAIGMGTAAGSFIAQASGGAADNLAPWATGGGAAAAVGGIVYIARLMATGRLVARDTAVAEASLTKLAADLVELVKASAARETDYRRLLIERFEAGSGRRSSDRSGDE